MTHGEAIRRALSDPEVRARVSAAQKQRFADPEVRVRQGEAIRRALADPMVRAKIREGRRRARAARGLWSPPETYAALYRRLSKDIGAAEARRLVEDQMRHDAARQ